MRDPDSADSHYMREIPGDGTIAAGITARLIQHAAASGVALSGLLAPVGWPSPHVPNPDARVPFAAHWGVWQHIHDQRVPGDFGLTFGDSFELDHLGVLGMLMAHSATVEEAVMQQTRFQRLLLDTPFKTTRLEPTKLVVEQPPLPIAMRLPHMIVAGLVYWVRVIRLLAGTRANALRV
ncbi:MAG: AraC family transcriptional regulator ligand-binding domain-containing protein, partial [Polyangiaceae bacterium]